MAEPHVLTASEDHTVPHGHQVGLQIGLDFINTYELERGRPVDHLTDLDTSLDWLREHQLLHQDAALAARERAAERPRARATASWAGSGACATRCATSSKPRPTAVPRHATTWPRSTAPCGRTTSTSSCRPRMGSRWTTATRAIRSRARSAAWSSRSPARSARATSSVCACAPTTPAAGSSSTPRAPVAGAGATWPPAATGPRPPATGRGAARARPTRPTGASRRGLTPAGRQRPV